METREYTPEENFEGLFNLFTARFEDYGVDDLLRQVGRYWSPAQRLALFEMLHDRTKLNLNQTLQCRVYRNIRKDNLSIQQKGIVKARSEFIALSDVTFKVRPSGQKKVRETGQKNVHAFVCGRTFERVIGGWQFDPWSELFNPSDSLTGLVKPIIDGKLKWSQVHYNPFKADTFVDNSGEPIHFADYAFVCGNGQVWVLR